MKVCIVGGGASGLMLASLLSKYSDEIQVTILERYEHVGKKLLLTGNGRCNLSNIYIKNECYNNDEAFKIASSFDAINYFNSLGLMTYNDEEGRVYPICNTSNNVLDILRENKATIKENFNVIRILKKGDFYEIVSDRKETVMADIVILAMGGKTYYKENNGFLIASMLSCRVTSLKPSLCSLKVKEQLASIANLKARVKASLIINEKKVYEDMGEVLFKNDALSGIVIFQLSSIMSRYHLGNYQISLDLLPSFSTTELQEYLDKYSSLKGLFPKMIGQYILKRSANSTSLEIAKTIKNLTFNVLEPYDFKNAQVTSGGVSFKDLTDSLENKYFPNCYIIGEMLDGDGICGGYNLQFAFASANIVFKDILKKVGINHER